MNPREQACAAVRDAQERRDTRAEHAETQRAKALTHEILKEPPGKGEKLHGFPWPEPKPHPAGSPNAVNASLRGVTRVYPETGEQVISFSLENGPPIWLRLDRRSAVDLADSLMDFQERSLVSALDGVREGMASEYVALSLGARFTQHQELSRNVKQAVASTAPAAARAGNLFSRTFARIWGRS
jgi:hypothetical protein